MADAAELIEKKKNEIELLFQNTNSYTAHSDLSYASTACTGCTSLTSAAAVV